MEDIRKIDLMGIVNLTDDSFYAPSRCGADVKGVFSRMVAEGADIVDFGACSTRPGAEPVNEKLQWERFLGAFEAISENLADARISIDTTSSFVVDRAYSFLSSIFSPREISNRLIVNDISAGEDDSQMLDVVGDLQLQYIAMHKRGTPQTMQQMTDYDDVVDDVIRYFENFAEKAQKKGISRWVLDPGFGFAKTIRQNYLLLDSLSEFRRFNVPLLVGVSRKSMIYKPLSLTPETAGAATEVVHFRALQNGADILRVHDVAAAKSTVRLYSELMFRS